MFALNSMTEASGPHINVMLNCNIGDPDIHTFTLNLEFVGPELYIFRLNLEIWAPELCIFTLTWKSGPMIEQCIFMLKWKLGPLGYTFLR